MLLVPQGGKVNSEFITIIIRNEKIKKEELSDKNTAMTKEISLLSKSRCKVQCSCVIITSLFVGEVGIMYTVIDPERISTLIQQIDLCPFALLNDSRAFHYNILFFKFALLTIIFFPCLNSI